MRITLIYDFVYQIDILIQTYNMCAIDTHIKEKRFLSK